MSLSRRVPQWRAWRARRWPLTSRCTTSPSAATSSPCRCVALARKPFSRWTSTTSAPSSTRFFFLILLLYFIPFYFKRKKQHCSKPLTHLFYLFIYFLQARQGKCPFASFKAGSEPDTLVQDLKWSPVEAFRVAACLSDGSMMVLDVTEKVVVVAQLPASVGITCGECVFSHFSYLQLVYSHVEFFIS